MKSFRVSIGRAMTVIGFIALNLGVFRALFATRRVEFLVVGLLFSAALQVAGWRALRGRARPFWTGSFAGGAVVVASWIGAYRLPRSVLGMAWRGYRGLTLGWLESMEPAISRAMGSQSLLLELGFLLAEIVAECLPFVVAAVAAGLLVRGIVGRGLSLILSADGREFPAAGSPAPLRLAACDPAVG